MPLGPNPNITLDKIDIFQRVEYSTGLFETFDLASPCPHHGRLYP